MKISLYTGLCHQTVMPRIRSRQ